MSSPLESEEPAFERFVCPGCGEKVEVAAESAGKLVRCSYCNTEFFASVEQAHLPVVDDTEPQTTEADRENTIDRLRIDNYTALRMGAIRARSWWIIGFFLAILVVLNMLGNTIIYVWVLHRWDIWPTMQTAGCILAVMFARHAYRRAADYKREIDHSALSEPTTPPDFSTLDNGSERWKHLENIR